MLYLVPALCIVVCAFFIARYFAVKTRHVEKAIDETIARKLATSALNVELSRLKEENGVMRNLLIDMVENEGSVSAVGPAMSAAERTRVMNDRTQRRREIFGEAIFALQQTGKSHSASGNLKIRG